MIYQTFHSSFSEVPPYSATQSFFKSWRSLLIWHVMFMSYNFSLWKSHRCGDEVKETDVQLGWAWERKSPADRDLDNVWECRKLTLLTSRAEGSAACCSHDLASGQQCEAVLLDLGLHTMGESPLSLVLWDPWLQTSRKIFLICYPLGSFCP